MHGIRCVHDKQPQCRCTCIGLAHCVHFWPLARQLSKPDSRLVVRVRRLMLWERLIQCSKPSLAIVPLALPPPAPDPFTPAAQLLGPPPAAVPAVDPKGRRSEFCLLPSCAR